MILALALGAVAVLGLGTAGLFHRWNGLMRHQLRLDRCVAEKALQLRDLNNRIESANARIREARIAAAVGTILPSARETIIAAAEALALFQDGLLASWSIQRVKWVAIRCGDSGDAFGTLPEASWFRPPPDPLGPQPLEWPEGIEKELRIQARHGPRAASAFVASEESTREELNLAGGSPAWHARWVPAR